MSIEIQIISGPDSGVFKRFEEDRDEISIGRADHADLRLSDAEQTCAAGIHARLIRDDDGWSIICDDAGGLFLTEDGSKVLLPHRQRKLLSDDVEIHLSQAGPAMRITIAGAGNITLAADDSEFDSDTGQASPAPAVPNVSFDLDALLAGRDALLIGRGDDCEIRLAHPTVSWHHAALKKTSDGLTIRDFGSRNGTYVAGQRIVRATSIRPGDRIGIGPLLFVFDGTTFHTIDLSRGLRLSAHGLDQEITLGRGKTRKLLDDINFVIEPGEFVAALGPSGAGKTTLVSCLNGRLPATRGKVLANGVDLYHHYHQFSQSLGYVPQRDIVHTGLTVERALKYTARLRLPRDTREDELQARVEEVLTEMELTPHRRTMIGNLSGGQIKRVSLGAELLADPSLLFIDEATSGLDAGIESRMMRLFRKLADGGRSLLCITHNVDNVDACNLVLVLAMGKLIYFGPPADALEYFGVSRLGLIYDRLSEKDPNDWAEAFRKTATFSELVEKRLAKSGGMARGGREKPEPTIRVDAAAVSATVMELDRLDAPALQSGENSSPVNLSPGVVSSPADSAQGEQAQSPLIDRMKHRLSRGAKAFSRQFYQFRVLSQRYLELLLRDRRSLRLLMMQAPIVAVCLLLGFVHRPYDAKLPMTRPMNDAERAVLATLQNAAGATQPPPPGQRAAPVTFTIIDPTGTRTIPPREVAMLLRSPKQNRTIIVDNGKTRTVLKQDQLDIVLQEFQQANASGDSTMLNAPIIPSGTLTDPAYSYMLMSIIGITVFWFGCNNAAKEIVKELPIYTRERSANLRIMPYLFSKLVVLGAITAVQVGILLAIVYGTLEFLHMHFGHAFPAPQYILAPGWQLVVLIFLGVAGVALGLLLSTCVATADRANALLPYVLIPQIIFGGAIVPLGTQPLRGIALTLSPVCWAFQAMHRGADLLPTYSRMFSTVQYSVPAACFALMIQTAVLFAAALWFLHRKDAV